MGEPRLITVGVIAEACGTTPERARHILRTRPHIRPVARAGFTRLYLPEIIALVRHELSAIDARRAAKNGLGDVSDHDTLDHRADVPGGATP